MTNNFKQIVKNIFKGEEVDFLGFREDVIYEAENLDIAIPKKYNALRSQEDFLIVVKTYIKNQRDYKESLVKNSFLTEEGVIYNYVCDMCDYEILVALSDTKL